MAPELVWLEADTSVEEARNRLAQARFAIAPVRIEGGGFVLAADLKGAGSIGAIARPLDRKAGIDARLGLGAAIAELGNNAHRIVYDGDEPVQMWSRADLQAPQVSLLTFAFGLAAEAGLSRIIGLEFGDRWLEQVSDGVREKIERIWQDKREDGLELTRLECLYLSDRLNICSRSEAIRVRLGIPDRSEFDKWASEFIRLRNELAHGGNLLRHESDPVAAVALFGKLRGFAERTWD